MANKKLKVEVELDTAKAKRQAKELEMSGSGGGASVGSPSVATHTPRSADRLADSLDKASRSVSKFGEEAGKTSSNMGQMVKWFAGMGVGLAASYAEGYMKPGAAKTTVGYIGAAITGASTGAAVGSVIPGVGTGVMAVVGAGTGVAKKAIDDNAKENKAAEEFVKYDDAFEEARKWNGKIRGLTEIEQAPVVASRKDANADQRSKVDERIEQLKRDIEEQYSKELRLKQQIVGMLKEGKSEQTADDQHNLQLVRTRREQLEAISRAYEKQRKSLEREAKEIELEEKKKKKTPDFRESLTATDALQKIGLGGPSAEAVAATVASVSSTRSGRGFGFSVPERSYQETRFGNFEKPNNDFKIITPLESAERNGRMSLETLRNIYQVLQQKNGGVAWQ